MVELRCTADLGSKTGGPTAGRKVKGTIHWVSAAHAIDAEVRLYDRLFTVAEPDAGGDFKQHLNPHSLEVVTAKCEPSLKDAQPGLRYQFERLGYFALDKDSTPESWSSTGPSPSKTRGRKDRDPSPKGAVPFSPRVVPHAGLPLGIVVRLRTSPQQALPAPSWSPSQIGVTISPPPPSEPPGWRWFGFRSIPGRLVCLNEL